MQIFFSLLASVALSAAAAGDNSGSNLDVLLTVLWRSMLHVPSRGAAQGPTEAYSEATRPAPLVAGSAALPTRRWCVPVGLALLLESPLLKVWQALKARQSKQWETQAEAEAQTEAGKAPAQQRPAIAQLRAKANAVKRMRPGGAAALAASSTDSLGGGGVLVGVGDAVPIADPSASLPPRSSLGESSRARRLCPRVVGARARAPACVSTASSSSFDGALVAPTANCASREPSYNVALSIPSATQALSPPPPPPPAGPNLMDIIAPGAVVAPSALARARLANKRRLPKLPTTFRRKSSGPMPPPPTLPQASSTADSLGMDDLPSAVPPPPPPMPPPGDEARV